MAKFLAVIVSAAVLSGLGACDADAPKSERKQAKSQQPHKPLRHEKLFADTRKHFAEQAAKTAENIKLNAAKLKKTISSEAEPEPEPAAKAKAKAKAKKPQQKKTSKVANDQPAKSD